MNFDKFKGFFHESWHDKVKRFIESEECNEIYRFLKMESGKGKKIAPISSLTYRAFKETPLKDVKVVLLGYCPYHTFVDGSPIADGLMFSCSVTGTQQPSLELFLNGIEDDLYDGLSLNWYKGTTDLTYLAEQGVLLLNSALTVEKDKPGSHQELWMPFTKYILEQCFAYSGIPIVLIGKQAQDFEGVLEQYHHPHIFKLTHPAYAARLGEKWETNGVFTQINKILKDTNNYEIRWLNEENDDPPF